MDPDNRLLQLADAAAQHAMGPPAPTAPPAAQLGATGHLGGESAPNAGGGPTAIQFNKLNFTQNFTTMAQNQEDSGMQVDALTVAQLADSTLATHNAVTQLAQAVYNLGTQVRSGIGEPAQSSKFAVIVRGHRKYHNTIASNHS